MREQTLLEENNAYENAISICEARIEEKTHEADSLLRQLKVCKAENLMIRSCLDYEFWMCFDIIWFTGARRC